MPVGVAEAVAANALVKERWWHFTGTSDGELEEADDEAWVIEHLMWLIGHGIAYDTELMSQARASELAETFVSLLPEHRRWFTNIAYEESKQRNEPPASGWTFSLTGFTMEGGFIATAGGAGVTQAFNVASLNGITSASSATAYSVAQELVTTAWNLLFAIVLMAWAFGVSGGKQLVGTAYSGAKQKQAERKAARRAKKEAERGSTA